MSFKIIDSVWFELTSRFGNVTLGMVAGETQRKEKKVYIGFASGEDQTQDEEYILKRGCPVNPSILRFFKKHLVRSL